VRALPTFGVFSPSAS